MAQIDVLRRPKSLFLQRKRTPSFRIGSLDAFLAGMGWWISTHLGPFRSRPLAPGHNYVLADPGKAKKNRAPPVGHVQESSIL